MVDRGTESALPSQSISPWWIKEQCIDLSFHLTMVDRGNRINLHLSVHLTMADRGTEPTMTSQSISPWQIEGKKQP
jgi:hypothetical protein